MRKIYKEIKNVTWESHFLINVLSFDSVFNLFYLEFKFDKFDELIHLCPVSPSLGHT